NDILNIGVAGKTTSTFGGQAGDDTVTVDSAGFIYFFDGGDDNDVLTLLDGGEVDYFDGGSGDDVLNVGDGALVNGNFYGDNGEDKIQFTGTGTASVANVYMVEYFYANQATGTFSVELSGGAENDDTMYVKHIDSFTGSSDSETVSYQAQTVAGDSIDLGVGTDTVNLYDAVNTISVRNVETVNGGSMADTVTLYDIANTISLNNVETVYGGTSADAITIGGTSNVLVVGGDGADTATNSGSGTMTVKWNAVSEFGDIINNWNGGAGQDVLDFDVAGVTGLFFDTAMAGTNIASNLGVAVITDTIADYANAASVATALARSNGAANVNQYLVTGNDTHSAIWHWNNDGNTSVESGELTQVALMNNVSQTDYTDSNFVDFSPAPVT
ncbi:MAG: hypothetical protein MI741_12145, partial [Rhodospirillales bacterium]|nr:hypothetical protein [Rhodospirillales bacterium]